MKVKELISELEKINGEVEIYTKYSRLDCCGHSEGSRCYCPYEDIISSLNSVDLYQNMRVLSKSFTKNPGLVIECNY